MNYILKNKLFYLLAIEKLFLILKKLNNTTFYYYFHFILKLNNIKIFNLNIK